jgi:hypothetical protein
VKASPTIDSFEGESGRTPWIAWTRKPRLNSAVATVGVLTVFSLLRVSGFMGGPQ